jgi:hypothetical protein
MLDLVVYQRLALILCAEIITFQGFNICILIIRRIGDSIPYGGKGDRNTR